MYNNLVLPLLIVLITTSLVFALLSVLEKGHSGCSVILTGESIKLLNCNFSPDFLDYAKGLEVLKVGSDACGCHF